MGIFHRKNDFSDERRQIFGTQLAVIQGPAGLIDHLSTSSRGTSDTSMASICCGVQMRLHAASIQKKPNQSLGCYGTDASSMESQAIECNDE